jgi:hypothetical protein
MRLAAVGVCVAMVAVAASDAWSQDNPAQPGVQMPATTGVAPAQAPVGHRQPTPKDLPPDLARGQQPADVGRDVGRGEQQTEGAAPRGKNARGRGGGPPTLQVGPSCEAAGRGSVVLGRDKKACLADESTAQDTLRQNWSKYAATDKSQCIGMATTGGPASYVELLSCLEIMRDARNIQKTDMLESDDKTNSTISGRRRNRR